MKKIIFWAFVLSLPLYLFLVRGQGLAQGSDASIVAAGKLDDFPEGTVKPFLDDKIIVFRDEGGLYAISTECTHNGCNLSFVERMRTFMCPCHGSSFNKKGEVLSGPAEKSLPWYSVDVDTDGNVKIDKSKTVAAGTKYKKREPEASDKKQ